MNGRAGRQSRWANAFYALGALVLTIGLLHFAAPLLMPIGIAMLLALLLAPAVRRLERIGAPRVMAVGIAVMTVLVALSGLAWVVTEQANQLLDAFPRYEDNLRRKLAVLRTDEGTLLSKLRAIARKVDREISGPEAAPKGPDEAVKVTVVRPDTEFSLSNLPTLAGTAAPAIGGAILCVALLAFTLMRREDLRERVFGLAGRSRIPMTTRAMDEAWERISRTLLIQFSVNASYGVLFGLGLYLIGIPFAPLWGLLAIALRYVPFIGSTLALALPLAVSVLMMQGWQGPILVLGWFGLLAIATMALEAWVVGPGIGVSPTATLIMLAFWTWLWGPVALILATPLTACFMVAARFLPQFRFVEIALGNRPVLRGHERLYQRLLSTDLEESGRLFGDYVRDRGYVPACDQLLVPALLDAAGDFAVRRISTPEYEQVLDSAGTLLGDLRHATDAVDAEEKDAERPSRDTRALRVYCLSRNDIDSLGHAMLQMASRQERIEFEIGSTGLLLSEALDELASKRIDVVCIGNPPYSGLPAAKLACRRIHRRFPAMAIVVARWGRTANPDRESAVLRAAGAAAVHGSIEELRLALIALAAARTQPTTLAAHQGVAAEASVAPSLPGMPNARAMRSSVE